MFYYIEITYFTILDYDPGTNNQTLERVFLKSGEGKKPPLSTRPSGQTILLDHLVVHFYWHNTLLDKPGQDVRLI